MENESIKIRPIHILDFYKHLQQDGIRKDRSKGKVSNSTIMHYHRLLRKMFNDAVKWELISENPISKVDPPKIKKKEAGYYDENEIKELISALEHEKTKYKLAIMLTITAGLRLGELTGLKWDSVNFEDSYIKIEQSHQYIPGEGTFIKEPKTESSKRIISLPAPIIRLLKIHEIEEKEKRLKCGDLWEGDGFILTQWNGKPMHPTTPSSWFSKFIKRKGLKKIMMLCLRMKLSEKMIFSLSVPKLSPINII
ncbi:tyrosine-type recombinase/integrase [Dethiothermospora halolimnae]|uniref:tyrosine-type recombinase/integrase n=1 Tax=Dethiothermospora halolimnae TaxID=3114390 RepID=UPI003CCBBA10